MCVEKQKAICLPARTTDMKIEIRKWSLSLIVIFFQKIIDSYLLYLFIYFFFFAIHKKL